MFYLILVLAFIVCFYLHKAYIQYAPSFGLVDIPNHRSSHNKPKPRGVGIVLVFCFYLFSALLVVFKYVEMRYAFPLIVSLPLVSLIGFLDDRKPLPPRLRFTVQILSASLAILALTDAFTYKLSSDFLPIQSQVVLTVLCILFVGWMINLYNFMDGIDGLAGFEGFTVAFLAACITHWQNYQQQFYLYSLMATLLVAFIWFNWYPAKVFMGDCGSYFLGGFFAILAIVGDQHTGMSVATNIILLSTFIVDASFTLIVRFLRGRKIYHPHTSFGFHKAKKKGLRVSSIAFFFGVYNLVYLGPLAALSVIYKPMAWLFVILAFIPITILEIYFKAGFD